jgi:hypothetical protein
VAELTDFLFWFYTRTSFFVTYKPYTGGIMEKQQVLVAESDEVADLQRLKTYCERYSYLADDPHPKKITDGKEGEVMSPEEINAEANKLISDAEEVLLLDERSGLDHTKMLAINHLLRKENLSMSRLRKLYQEDEKKLLHQYS